MILIQFKTKIKKRISQEKKNNLMIKLVQIQVYLIDKIQI
jgi:hypothetical protein